MSTSSQSQNKCSDTIRAVLVSMKNFGLGIPKRYEGKFTEDLAVESTPKKEHVARLFSNLKAKSGLLNEIERLLNDLLVYAEAGKTLNSELISEIVMAKLKRWNQLLNQPGTQISVSASPKVLGYPVPRKLVFDTPPTARVNISKQSRQSLAKYGVMGKIKKDLYSRPDYKRDQRGPILPPHLLPPASNSSLSKLGPHATNADQSACGLRERMNLKKTRELQELLAAATTTKLINPKYRMK